MTKQEAFDRTRGIVERETALTMLQAAGYAEAAVDSYIVAYGEDFEHLEEHVRELIRV